MTEHSTEIAQPVPYYQDDLVTLYHGKFEDVLPKLGLTDVGAIVTDPPYATPRAVRRKAKPAHHQGARGPSYYTSEDGGPRLMRSVMYHRSMHGRAINETEKPVPLVVPLVEYAVPPGGLVLDLFAGSSSTLDAARITGRRAVGIEQRESQCEKAADRLSSQIVFEIGGGVA